MVGFYSFCIALVVAVILALTPLKEIVLIFEKERLAEQQHKIEQLEDKIVYLSNELSKIVSTNKKLKYAILLGTIDSLDTNSAIYDSLKKDDDPIGPENGGSIYNIFLKIIENFFQDSSTNITFIDPVKGIISNKFLPVGGHFGVDFAVKSGTPVIASAGGLVIFANYTSEFGNMLILQHKNDYISVYKHCQVLLKKEREYVYQGELIALSGNSGTKTTGPHLHFEIWKSGKPIDPQKVLIN
jgi:murein DD-endopeptidase MepM/ murein hydrolase activator NlpD